MSSISILITGSGDIATAAALRLFRSGYKVILFASDHPIDVHHNRTYSNAVYNGEKTVEQVTACTRSGSAVKGDCAPETPLNEFVAFTHSNRQIPIITQEDLSAIAALRFNYIFTADMPLFDKLPSGVTDSAVIICKAEDTFTAGSRYQVCADPVCLGRVIYPFNRDDFIDCGKVLPDSGPKEEVHAPLEGVFTTTATIGNFIHEKQELGRINDIPILSPASGKISGLLNSGLIIPAGTVFAEICSLSDPAPVKLIPAEASAVAGGVLEAILFDLNLGKSK